MKKVDKKSVFTKKELIESLRAMKRSVPRIEDSPGAITCYLPIELPEKLEHVCEKCSSKTVYSRRNVCGAALELAPYFQRDGADAPNNMSIDLTGLCSKCNKGKAGPPVVTLSCCKCGKRFSWEARTVEDINWLWLLNIRPPIDKDDMRLINSLTEDTGRTDLLELLEGVDIEKVAQYICEHVFCPECRE